MKRRPTTSSFEQAGADQREAGVGSGNRKPPFPPSQSVFWEARKFVKGGRGWAGEANP